MTYAMYIPLSWRAGFALVGSVLVNDSVRLSGFARSGVLDAKYFPTSLAVASSRLSEFPPLI